MNPRQRRAVLLLALAGAGLVGVFALVANYVSEIETEVGNKVVVLELTRPVPADQAVPDDAVRTRTIPERWKPEAAYTSRDQLVGQVAASDLQPRAILQEGMLAPPPEIDDGEREVAILVDASTGVAGKIQPDAEVDVIASYAAESGDPQAGTKPKRARTIVIVPGARVIAVGQPRLKGGNGATEAQQDPSEVVPVTFALSKKEVIKVAHAQTFAADVRLALLRRGDDPSRTLEETIFRGADPKQGEDGV